MNDERRRMAKVPADRREPVDEPVARGDPVVTGDCAREAVSFDPTDPDSFAKAARTARSFSESTVGNGDHVFMLRKAAACTALIRGVGSYKRTTKRAGGDMSVSFIRKWACVHDLPQPAHRYVAHGHITPTAAKHTTRVSGDVRLHLVWVMPDAGLTVREVRRLASEANDGTPAVDVLIDHGVNTGRLDVTLLADVYLELRCRVSLEDTPSGDVVVDVLDGYLD